MAHITGAIKGLAGKTKTNWREHTRTLLDCAGVRDGSQKGANRVTNGMQSLDVSDTVEFVRPWWFTVVYLTDSLKAVLLQIAPVGEVADNPSERVAEIDASSDW